MVLVKINLVFYECSLIHTFWPVRLSPHSSFELVASSSHKYKMGSYEFFLPRETGQLPWLSIRAPTHVQLVKVLLLPGIRVPVTAPSLLQYLTRGHLLRPHVMLLAS